MAHPHSCTLPVGATTHAGSLSLIRVPARQTCATVHIVPAAAVPAKRGAFHLPVAPVCAKDTPCQASALALLASGPRTEAPCNALLSEWAEGSQVGCNGAFWHAPPHFRNVRHPVRGRVSGSLNHAQVAPREQCVDLPGQSTQSVLDLSAAHANLHEFHNDQGHHSCSSSHAIDVAHVHLQGRCKRERACL